MSIFDDIMDCISPDLRNEIINKISERISEGKDLTDLLEETYTYQRPDYTRNVQPPAECLLCLHDAVTPADALAAYERIHDKMEKLSRDEQELILRNYLMNVLADGLTRDFGNEEEASRLHLFAVFQLVDEIMCRQTHTSFVHGLVCQVACPDKGG